MGWHELAFAFTDIPQLFVRNDDDAFDRLSHRWTAAKLIGFSILVSTTLYVGKPIHCWTPKHFKKTWGKYINSYCLVKNTYYLPFNERIPNEISDRAHLEIEYYQWMPMILLFGALMFYMPIAVWRTINSCNGLDMNDVIETSEKLQQSIDVTTKIKRLHYLTKQIHRYLSIKKKTSSLDRSYKWIIARFCCLCCKPQYGNSVTVLYVFVKLLFLANIILQAWILDIFFGNKFFSYGIHFIYSVVNREDWTLSERFPRVTLCDFTVRELGNNHRYTVQCVLPINFFNEKLFLYLWFWYVVMMFMTLTGLILLIFRMFIVPGENERYIKNHLIEGEAYLTDVDMDWNKLPMFTHDYLQRDGMLLLRLIGHNVDKVTVTVILCALWKNYNELSNHKKKKTGDMFDTISIIGADGHV